MRTAMQSRLSRGIGSGWVALCLALAALPLAARGQSAAGAGAEIGQEAATLLGAAAVKAAFGPSKMVGITPYFDPDGNVSVYAVEFSGGASVRATAIVSAWCDDVPVIMMWRGGPKHEDPATLALARTRIAGALGVTVTEPQAVFWLDAYEVWAEYPETNPKNGGPVYCNLYSGAVADYATLAAKWDARMANAALMHNAKTNASALRAAPAVTDPATAKARLALDRADYIGSLWSDAKAYLATPASSTSSPPPANYTGYIQTVPNIDQGATGDCGIVACMDVLLYWDRRGYDKLNDDNLGAMRTALRQAMQWSATTGTTDPNTETGARNFCNSATYGNQYSFTVTRNQWSSTSNPVFATLTAEILAGRPVMFGVNNYANDPSNPTDNAYSDHWVCAVGYYSGTLYAGSTSTRWVIIHDNWGGGTYTNPDLIDDEPYIDWSRGMNDTGDLLIRIRPGGGAVTPPTGLTVNGATVGGNISPAGDVDWYQFTASSAGTYTIETWAGTLTDNYMELYGPNSQTALLASDDDSGEGNAAKIVRSLSAGTHYVKIRAYSSSGTGTYTIRVTTASSGPAVTSFSINNGASSTTSRSVTLNNACSGSPNSYMASESSTFSGASWLTYATAPAFTLSSAYGTKTVYFKVKNSAGVASAVVNDQISLTAPAEPSKILDITGTWQWTFNETNTYFSGGATQWGRHSNLGSGYYEYGSFGKPTSGTNYLKNITTGWSSGSISVELWLTPYYNGSSGYVKMTRGFNSLAAGQYYYNLTCGPGYALNSGRNGYYTIFAWRYGGSGWVTDDQLPFSRYLYDD